MSLSHGVPDCSHDSDESRAFQQHEKGKKVRKRDRSKRSKRNRKARRLKRTQRPSDESERVVNLDDSFEAKDTEVNVEANRELCTDLELLTEDHSKYLIRIAQRNQPNAIVLDPLNKRFGFDVGVMRHRLSQKLRAYLSLIEKNKLSLNDLLKELRQRKLSEY